MSATPQTLYIRYKGWAVVRIPTDPDPSYEPNGASGYTFAFAGEPRLDRIFRLQPTAEYVRPGPNYPDGNPWPWGVKTYDVELGFSDGRRIPVPELVDAKVDLLGRTNPREPELAAHLPGVGAIRAVHAPDLERGRDARPAGRRPPRPRHVLAAPHGDADRDRGPVAYTWSPRPWAPPPESGIPVALYEARRAWLEEAIRKERDPTKLQALQSRLYEVNVGLTNGMSDNRLGAHNAVERFEFDLGPEPPPTSTKVTLPQAPGYVPDPTQGWLSAFMFACFDSDLLGAYLQGVLEVPLTKSGG